LKSALGGAARVPRRAYWNTDTPMKKKFYAFHRAVAPWLALPVALWAASGILHPLMANWLKPEISAKFLRPSPLVLSESAKPPSEVFADLPELHQLKVVRFGDGIAYLAITPDQKLHYRTTTGTLISDGAHQHAEMLAREFLGDKESPLVRIAIHDRFSANYTTINRLLPAYRVKLARDDGLEAVVDPRTGRLATYDSPSRRLMARVFSWLHTWSFLGASGSWLRITLVLLASTLALGVALTGMATLVFTRRRKKLTLSQPMVARRKMHRLLGAASALFFFLFGTSGILHVLIKTRGDDSPQWVSSQAVQTSKLKQVPRPPDGGDLFSVSLSVLGESAYYRLSHARQNRGRAVSLVSVHDGRILPNGEEEYAKKLALEFSGYLDGEITRTEQITSFRKDYGFIFKRLPVWRIHFQGKPFWHYTVDTGDAHLSMRTDLPGLVESLVFVNLHKFHFLDFAGRDVRDWATVAAATLLIALVISGVRAKRRRAT